MATEYADILLTLDGDLDLSTNDIQLTQTNLQSLRQRLALRFEVWSGGQDWLYNTTFGTPWRSYIGKAVAKSAIDAELRRQILLESDVDSITSFTSVQDKASRTYQAYFEVSTSESEVIALAFFLPDSFTYSVPNINLGNCQVIEDSILFGNKLYKLINFDMKKLGPSSWINDWVD